MSVDLIKYNSKDNIKKKKKSIVVTWMMPIFSFFYFIVIYLKIGAFYNSSPFPIILGTVVVIFGVVLNVAGRIQLRGNWANEVIIYSDHVLITSGAYKIVRHPLYFSLILMFLGGGLANQNWLSLVSVAFVFVPLVYYQARQEENFLEQEFAGYKDYRKKTGMLIPKLFKNYSNKN